MQTSRPSEQASSSLLRPEEQSLDWANIVGWLLIVCGAALAIVQFVYNRSLWEDEAMLALNIVGKPVGELFLPLSHDQVAPILFLLVEKAISTLWPHSEMGLRLFPLLVWFLSLILFQNILRSLVHNKLVRLFAIAMFVFDPTLLRYSSEVKQYGSDVFVALALIALVLRAPRPGSTVMLAIAGAVAVALSNVAPVTLLCCGGYLLYRFLKHGEGSWKALIVLSVVWAGTFALYYVAFIEHHPTRDMMLRFWEHSFMPLNPFDSSFWKFIGYAVTTVFGGVFAIRHVVVVLGLLFLVGLFALTKSRRWGPAILLVLPLFVHLALSAARLYPFDTRMILYLSPAVLLTAAMGLEFLLELLPRFRSPVSITVVAALALGAIVSLIRVGFPVRIEEIKESLGYVTAHFHPGDSLYLYYGTHNAVEYYRLQGYPMPPLPTIEGGKNPKDPTQFISDFDELSGKVWVLFSHDWKKEVPQLMHDLTARGATTLDTFRAPGSDVYLVELPAH